MRTLAAVFRELTGLFIEDSSLTLAVLIVIILAALAAYLMPDMPLAAGAILLFGSLGVLLANVLRAARH